MYFAFQSLKSVFTLADSADANEMLLNAASHLGLHCQYISVKKVLICIPCIHILYRVT